MSTQQEPTSTKGLREDFRTELTVRFRALKGAIRETVGYTYDALDLKQGGTDELYAAADDVTPAETFQFTTDQEARDAFNDWLETQIDRGILESTSRTAIRNGDHYTASYIRSTYARGVDHADAQLNSHGVEVPEQDLQQVFNQGVAQGDLENLYTRAFDELEGITQDLQQEIRRELATGFSEGWNPQKTARKLNERTDVGITRAERLARTETMHGHNTGAASRYQEHGVEKVEVLTYEPCPICQSLEAQNPHPIDDAPIVPSQSHPNCVCTIAPVV